MNVRLALSVLLLTTGVTLVLPRAAGGDDDDDATTPKLDLRASWPSDLATSVAVPLSNGTSLVVGLPEHMWIQAPCNAKDTVCFVGDGLLLQDVVDTKKGHGHSIAFLGAASLPKPASGEAFDTRLDRFVAETVAGIGKAYARMNLELAAPTEAVPVNRTEIQVGDALVKGWRTDAHSTFLAGYSGHAMAKLRAEVVFVGDEASNSCVCLVCTSKLGSLSLDQLIANLSIRKTPAANAGGHRIQMIDVSVGRGDDYPLRFAAYDAPAGFVPTLPTLRLRQELINAEDRLDEKGRVTATWRISHRERDASKPMASEVEAERKASGGKDLAPTKTIDLGTPGAQAFLFTSKVKVADRAGVASTAVLELADRLWSITWTTFGDDAMAKADQAAFETLLRGMELAIRVTGDGE